MYSYTLSILILSFSLQEKEEELTKKRELLLDKNTTLASLPTSSQQVTTVDTLQLEPTEPIDIEEEGAEPGLSVGESPDDVINDIMSLNEEVEVVNDEVSLVRSQLKKLADIVGHAQYEDIGEEDEYEAAAKLSVDLSSEYLHFKSVESKLHEIIQSLEELRQKQGYSSTPLPYMMQLPPLRAGEGVGQEAWLHTLPDRLTGKTNCEMRVERCLLREMIKYTEELQQRCAIIIIITKTIIVGTSPPSVILHNNY